MVTEKWRLSFVLLTLHWHHSTWTPCRLTDGDSCSFTQLAEYRSTNYGSLLFENLTMIMSQSGLFFKAAVPLYRILRSAQATHVSHYVLEFISSVLVDYACPLPYLANAISSQRTCSLFGEGTLANLLLFSSESRAESSEYRVGFKALDPLKAHCFRLCMSVSPWAYLRKFLSFL